MVVFVTKFTGRVWLINYCWWFRLVSIELQYRCHSFFFYFFIIFGLFVLLWRICDLISSSFRRMVWYYESKTTIWL